MARLMDEVAALKVHLPFLVSKALLWRDGSVSSMDKSQKDKATKALRSSLAGEGIVTCQVLGDLIHDIPSNILSLAHLCKLSWVDGTHRLLGMSREEVSSKRNALLLSKVGFIL